MNFSFKVLAYCQDCSSKQKILTFMAEEETGHSCKEAIYTLLHNVIFFRKKTFLCQLFFLLKTTLCSSTEEPLLFQVHAQHLSKS